MNSESITCWRGDFNTAVNNLRLLVQDEILNGWSSIYSKNNGREGGGVEKSNFTQQISELITTGNFINMPEERTDSLGTVKLDRVRIRMYTATKMKELGMNLDSKSAFRNPIPVTQEITQS